GRLAEHAQLDPPPARAGRRAGMFRAGPGRHAAVGRPRRVLDPVDRAAAVDAVFHLHTATPFAGGTRLPRFFRSARYHPTHAGDVFDSGNARFTAAITAFVPLPARIAFSATDAIVRFFAFVFMARSPFGCAAHSAA